MFRTAKTLASQATRRGRLAPLAHKAYLRIREIPHRRRAAEAEAWCERWVQPTETVAAALDAALWDEARDFAAKLSSRAAQVLETLPVTLGGGGHYALLYFLVRYFRPRSVLETGVAAGFSTSAVLTGLRDNGEGRLFSSELPYLRLEDADRYVGILVEPDLKERWSLFLGGDRHNLQNHILPQVDNFDLVHYDSDKSYTGRRFFMDALRRHLHERSIVIMDDIQDNMFFADYVQQTGSAFTVLDVEGKFVGCLGLDVKA